MLSATLTFPRFYTSPYFLRSVSKINLKYPNSFKLGKMFVEPVIKWLTLYSTHLFFYITLKWYYAKCLALTATYFKRLLFKMIKDK